MYLLFQKGDYPPLRRWAEPSQIVFFAAFAFLLYFFSGLILTTLGLPDVVREDLAKRSNFKLVGIFLTKITYPFATTIFAQWLPMLLVRWMKKPVKTQMIFAGAWFAFLHIKLGPAEVIQQFFVGWVLATCFVFCRRDSFAKAYRATSIAHALTNSASLAYMLLFIWLR